MGKAHFPDQLQLGLKRLERGDKGETSDIHEVSWVGGSFQDFVIGNLEAFVQIKLFSSFTYGKN
jgi:hypothetical protein